MKTSYRRRADEGRKANFKAAVCRDWQGQAPATSRRRSPSRPRAGARGGGKPSPLHTAEARERSEGEGGERSPATCKGPSGPAALGSTPSGTGL